MELIIKFVEKVFQIPQVSIVAMFFFLFAIRRAKKHFDSKITETSFKKRFVVEEFKSIDKSNAYLVEQIFSERYGCLMNYKEIMYFLRTSRPSLNMYLYRNSAPYFIFNKTGSQLKLHSYITFDSLRNKGHMFITGYYLFAMLGLVILQMTPTLLVKNMPSGMTSLLIAIGLLFLAAVCESAQLKTKMARELLLSIEYENS